MVTILSTTNFCDRLASPTFSNRLTSPTIREAEAASNTGPPLGKWIPGYLGLLFDEDRYVVGREGINDEVPLSHLNWCLLRKLNSFGNRPASRDALKLAWKDADLAVDPDDARIDDALTDLRKLIKPLGLGTKAFRRLGWTIVPTKTKPTSATQRPRKST